MGKALKRFVTRTVLVLVALVAAYGGWRWGDAVFPAVEAALGIGQAEFAELPVNVETAARATAKIEEFQVSEDHELRLESAEVSSLLRYSIPGIVPSGVLDPTVSFEGDRVEVRARVLPSRISDLPRLGGIAGILPDTVNVVVQGSLSVFGDEVSVLVVEGVELQGWPIPAAAVPEILAALGHEPPPDAPPAAVPVPELSGLRAAHIEDGKLVVVRT